MSAQARERRPGLDFRLAWRYTRWDLRGSSGRIVYWMACLAIGVSAVVSIAALAHSLDQTIRREARSLLAADLAISSQIPLSEELESELAAWSEVQRVDLRETVGLIARSSRTTSAHDGARSVLAELRSVEGDYPFYGEVEMLVPDEHGGLLTATSDTRPIPALLAPTAEDERPGALVAQEALQRLGLEIGDDLLVGRARMRIAAVLVSEPDRVPGLLSVGPAVLVSGSAFERTGLGGFGNLSRRKTLLALRSPDSATGDVPAEELERAKARLEGVIGDNPSYRVETYQDAQPLIREGLADLENFLGLVALLSLLVGGVGIAQGVRTWLSSRVDSLAVLKCLGLRPRELFALYLGQTMLLGLVGSLVGGVIGLLGVLLVPLILRGLVPPEAIQIWQPLALLRGLVLGVGVATAFALPPLLSVLRVPPARVFRRTAEALPGSRRLDAMVFIALALVVTGLAAWQAGSILIGAGFLGGVAVTLSLVGIGAWLLSRLARRLATERRRFWLRQALAALARPGQGTLGALTALGLGLLVLLTMAQMQEHVRRQLSADLPSDAPSAFFINIEKDQWSEVEQTLLANGATDIDTAPVVLGRIRSIDGRAAAELADEREAGWAFRREMRLTYAAELPADNQILRRAGGVDDGVWVDEESLEVSLEEEFAEGLGVDLGSTIALQVADRTYDLVVTSVRSVDWEGFGINFFAVVEPLALEDAPQTRLAAAQLPAGSEQQVQDAIATSYPNVTMFGIRRLLDRVVGLMRRLSFGMRVLGSFTILAGAAILAGAIATSSAQRSREVALLKTLGMRRGEVLRVFGTEYALLGVVAALVASVGSVTVAWFVITQLFENDFTWRFDLLGLGLLVSVVLTTGIGLLASRHALRTPPVEILREN